jgi:L-lactate dehydrogenase complex protein LldF
VEIPIPEILVRLRREATHEDAGSNVAGKGTGRTAIEDWTWRIWALVLKRPALYRVAIWFATRFGKALPAGAPLIRNWTRSRTKPVPAHRSLQERMRAEGGRHD